MNQDSLQIRAQLIIPVLIVTLLMLTAWTLTQWSLLGRIIQSQRGSFVTELSQEWKSALENTATSQENLLYQIGTNKSLLRAFLAQDREQLLAIMKPLLDYYRQTAAVAHLYVHRADGVNYLRAHRPQSFGDKIDRETLKRAQSSSHTSSGIEVSSYGQTLLRSVQPWFHRGELIGYLEIATSPQIILDRVSDIKDVDLALLVNKKHLNKTRWTSFTTDNEQTQDQHWDQYENHLKIAHTGTAPDKDISNYFDTNAGSFSLNTRKIGELASQIEFTDVTGRPIGKLLIKKDFKWLVSELSGLIRQVVLVFIGLIAVTVMLYGYFAKRLSNRLNIGYRALTTEIQSRKVAEESLLEYQKDLEKIVADRTEALRKSNQDLSADIELREQTERMLAESTQKYRALFNGSTDIIFAMRDNRLIDANVTAHSLLDFNKLKRHTLTLDQILKCTEKPPTRAVNWLKTAQESGSYRAEMTFQGQEQNFPVDVVITYINEDDGTFYLITCRDISERKAALAKVEYQALYDPLTDLPNRRLFMEELQRATQLCRRQNQKGAILFIDLDHFKNINDTLGHSVGDLLLQEVAKRLKDCIRAEDTVARFGGDEFVVILPCSGTDNEEAANNSRAAAEKISIQLTEIYEIGEHMLHVTPSIGIAIFPKLNETTEDILKQADAALFGAKGAGRNTIHFFEPKMQSANEERLILEKELRQALSRDQFFINLQTKHDGNGEVIGSECLLRWSHPELGMVSPFHFITIAEETGIITSIGQWVIEQVCQWIAHCRDNNLPTAYGKVAVNLSPLQLFQQNFVNDLWSAVQKYQVPPENMTLEITENILIKDFDGVIKLLQKLKDLGFMISVDDFGTGYSSLRYLKNLPIDELKIDQSFVREIHTSHNDRAIAETIISMARHLSLQVVAEGVENIEQFGLLKELGCERFQGYYFAKPIKTGELIDRIRASA